MCWFRNFFFFCQNAMNIKSGWRLRVEWQRKRVELLSFLASAGRISRYPKKAPLEFEFRVLLSEHTVYYLAPKCVKWGKSRKAATYFVMFSIVRKLPEINFCSPLQNGRSFLLFLAYYRYFCKLIRISPARPVQREE